jgi:hypothetical protein
MGVCLCVSAFVQWVACYLGSLPALMDKVVDTLPQVLMDTSLNDGQNPCLVEFTDQWGKILM